MFVSFLNIWTGFLFTTIILGIYIFIYFNVFGGFAEIKWKLIYFSISWVLTILYLFFEIDIILQQFSFQLGNLLIIKDLQDLINISLDLAFWLSFWFVIPLLIYYCWTFFFNLWTLQEQQSWSLFLLLCSYFFFLFKFLLDYDLFLACWDFFKKIPQTFYDFQPDFFFIIVSYLGDFVDLGKFFCLILSLFFLSFLFQWNINEQYATTKIIYFRILFSLLYGFILFYFFGGESFIRDIFLFINIYLIFEFYYFFYLFFYILKHKRIF